MKNETFIIKENLDTENNRSKNLSSGNSRQNSHEKSGYVERMLQKNKIKESKSTSRLEHIPLKIPKESKKSHKSDSGDLISLKGNLFKALYNINKELNVKIDNKEQSRVDVDLNIFLMNQDSDSSKQTKRVSKKVDVDNLIGSFGNGKGLEVYDPFTLQNKEDLIENRVRQMSDKKPIKHKLDISGDFQQDVSNFWEDGGQDTSHKEALDAVVKEGIIETDSNGEICNFDLNKLLQFVDGIVKKNKCQEITIAKMKSEVEATKNQSEYKKLYQDSEQLLKNQQMYIQAVEKENMLLKEQITNFIKARHERLLLVQQQLNEQVQLTSELSDHFFDNKLL
jgi:hypothetical protein